MSGTLVVGVDLYLGELVQMIKEKEVYENQLPFDEYYQLYVQTPGYVNDTPEGVDIRMMSGSLIASASLFRHPEPDVLLPLLSLDEAIAHVSKVAYGLMGCYIEKTEWEDYVAKHSRIIYDGDDGINDTLAQCEEDWDRYNTHFESGILSHKTQSLKRTARGATLLRNERNRRHGAGRCYRPDTEHFHCQLRRVG